MNLHKKYVKSTNNGSAIIGENKEAHLGLAQMYVDDPRFTEYYDNIAEGAAVFLRDALQIYCR